MNKRLLLLAVLVIGMGLPLLASDSGSNDPSGKSSAAVVPSCTASELGSIRLDRSTEVYTPERVARIRTRLADELRPDAMDTLNALLPETSVPVVMTPQSRIALLTLYLNSARQPVGDRLGEKAILTFLREVESRTLGLTQTTRSAITSKELMSDQFVLAASRPARRPRTLDTRPVPTPPFPPEPDCHCYDGWRWLACQYFIVDACPIRDQPPPVLVERRLLDRTPSGLLAIAPPYGDASSVPIADARSAASGSAPIAATSPK